MSGRAYPPTYVLLSHNGKNFRVIQKVLVLCLSWLTYLVILDVSLVPRSWRFVNSARCIVLYSHRVDAILLWELELPTWAMLSDPITTLPVLLHLPHDPLPSHFHSLAASDRSFTPIKLGTQNPLPFLCTWFELSHLPTSFPLFSFFRFFPFILSTLLKGFP